ncbi:MAG: permease, partial [Actinomycetota bacterium]|nr:permease [Actinomycetota bacterium]
MNELWGFTLRVLGESAEILADASPYLLFGFLAAGLLHGVISSETVARHLGRGRLGPVVKAALFGVPLPLCSCGVLPAALGLRKQGASKGATVSFLVSTPETGVDSIALTYALMDPVMTVFRPLAAFVTAVLAGDSLPSELGQITLVNFTNPGGLEALGGNLYRET